MAREGSAMKAALVADLHAIGRHEIVTTADARVARDLPRGVEVVALPGGGAGRPGTVTAAAACAARDLPRGVEVVALPGGDRARETALDRLIGGVEAVWLIAPETDRCLERLAARVERQRKPLLGSSADAIS